ncbi:MAG: hypothetical protein NW226_07090 [Microscillaceae bacterium]|nr:hypothetical protein [Microscillaceae bacterium]
MNTITNQTSTIRVKNPFPGLRPFNENESHLYFGRDKQVREVLDKLTQNRFVAIIGTSGIGKSSFIYCGLFPQLRQNEFSSQIPHFQNHEWEIYQMRPGTSPLQNLMKTIGLEPLDTSSSDFFAESQSTMTPQAHPNDWLIQALTKKSEANPLNPKNYLVFVDQFEEIFNDQNNPQQSADFVDVLSRAAQQHKTPIYIVITMRSDFIGNCSQYPEFTQQINESQFLIPYMTRKEKEEAIVMPIQKNGVQIEPTLVEMILDDVGNTLDQLPLMQHALMRTWDVWERSSDEYIRTHHYQQIGRITHALSKHADEAFNELTPNKKNICAKVFKAITYQKIRRPTPLGQVAAIANAPISEVKEVIEHFRREDCGLLMPPPDVALHEQSIIDISHESLISNWITLKKWVEEESESIKTYMRLAETAEMHQGTKDTLLKQPQLQLALSWWKDQKPSVAWAERYHTSFEYFRTEQFLDASEKSYRRDLENEEKLKQLKLRTARTITIVVSLIAILAGIFGIQAYFASKRAETEAKRALENLEEANKQKVLADSAKLDALEKAEQARKARESAEKDRIRAVEKEKEAERQKNIALDQRRRALEAQKLALLNEAKAKTASERAEMERRIAEIEKALAELAKQIAEKRRYLSLSKTMANKSSQMEDTTQEAITQKALLAKQAFDFNWEYGGSEHHPEIYDGLYNALAAIYNKEDAKKPEKDKKGYSQLKGHAFKIRAFAPYNDYQIFSAGEDGQIILLNSNWAHNSQDAVYLNDQPGLIHQALALNPGNQLLACAGYYPFIQLFNPQNLKAEVINIKNATKSHIFNLAFLSNRYLVSADIDNWMCVWDIADVNNIKKVDSLNTKQKFQQKIQDIAALNGKVYIALENQVIEIDPLTKQQTSSGIKNISLIRSFAMSKNGQMAIGNSYGAIMIFKNGEKLGELKGHKGPVEKLVFNQNSDQLASASLDGTVRIWNLENLDDFPIIHRDHILIEKGSETMINQVWALGFSPNGKKLLAGCSNTLVRAWPTEIKEMANALCPLINRNFSRDEWVRFIDDPKEIYYRQTCIDYPDGGGVSPEDKIDPNEKKEKLTSPSNQKNK